jgi:hypothetical protein
MGRKLLYEHPFIHPYIHPIPTKGMFQFCVYICGGSDVKKANLLWCPSIQHRRPTKMCVSFRWWRLGRTDGRADLIGCEESLFIVTSYRVLTSVRPTISLKPANYFLFQNLTFLCFLCFFWVRLCSFLPSSHPQIPTITGFMVWNFLCLQLVMNWFRHVEKASF